MRHFRTMPVGLFFLVIGVPFLIGLGVASLFSEVALGAGERWSYSWPNTDFSKSNIDINEVTSGGPPRDGIPPIDNPKFKAVDTVQLPGTEPVVGLEVGGVARAYPLRVLMWHEIVNDTIGGLPVTVTYCPLCNAAIVFDRRVEGRVLDFGTTGNLRNSDLVMWDRQTESWWQQFQGMAIVGEMTGTVLKIVPARLESYHNFSKRFPNGEVLVPNSMTMRQYGQNPYAGYDSAHVPFLYSGDYPEGIEPMARVIAVEDVAWSMALLRAKKRIEVDDLILTWEPGQNSALDSRTISEGRDVGNVVVQRNVSGKLEDVAYDVTFAFVFYAFRPDGTIHKE